MPFEKFKPPKIHAAIGTAIGKANGVIIAKANKSVTNATNKMRAKGCPGPAELAKLDSKMNGLGALTGTLTSSMGAFAVIPKSLKAPIGGLKAAVKIILSLPIPQAFPHVQVGPPGLPVNITTKYADTLNLLKEFIAAMEITADAIDFSLKNVANSVALISGRVKDLEAPIKACKIENILKSKLTKDQAKKLKLLDKDGEFITSTLGSKVLEKSNTRPASDQVKLDLGKDLGIDIALKGAKDIDTILRLKDSAITEGINTGDAYRLIPPGNIKLPNGETKPITGKEFAIMTQEGLDESGLPIFDIKFKAVESLSGGGLTGKAQALAELDTALNELSSRLTAPSLSSELSNSNTDDDTDLSTANNQSLDIALETLQEIQKALTDLSKDLVTEESDAIDDPELYYKGYLLKIVKDPSSPKLAPKHFAIGIKDGNTQIKGPSSFSSSKKVLLDEIKFRIDNQLS
ncbi:hypothetical protein N9H35_00375 [bacterium]|nr:hypothetical protein [bacterium]